MGIKNGLLLADVMHQRLRPRKNAFVYKVYYLCVPLEKVSSLGVRVLSHNRFNLFSLMDKDHGLKDGKPMADWLYGILDRYGLGALKEGRVVLLTLPRILGHVFNPVSFWFCLDQEGKLRAVLSEVSNTFKEKHCYLTFHEDGREITQNDLIEAKKVFHVSPFLKVEGHYVFRFAYKEDKVGVWIDYHDAEGELLKTAVTGKRMELSSRNLMKNYIRYPMVTLKVIGLIHWQAVKLWGKRVRFYTKPEPPKEEVTR